MVRGCKRFRPFPTRWPPPEQAGDVRRPRPVDCSRPCRECQPRRLELIQGILDVLLHRHESLMDLEHSTPRKPLRLWPGVVIVALQWLVMFGLPIVAPEHGGTAILGGFIGGLIVLLWWLFLSRARWMERLAAIAGDGRRRGRHSPSRSRVHSERDDGIHAVSLCRAAPEPWSCSVGRGQPRRVGQSPVRVDGRRNRARVRNVGTCAHQRCHRRRQVRFGMAVDANSGATASRADRRRTPRRLLGATRPRSHRYTRPPAATPESPSSNPSPPRPRRLPPQGSACPGDARQGRRRLQPPTNRPAALMFRQRRKRTRIGPAFADPRVTASFTACVSKRTGLARRRSSCGAAGRPRLVIVCRCRRSPFYPGAARRWRDRIGLQLEDRRTRVVAPRRG